MSDTGGGHRAAAEAIRGALQAQFDEGVAVKLVDVLKDYSPYPFNRMPAWYPTIIRRGPRAWKGGFKISNGPRRARMLSMAFWPYVRRPLRRLARDHPADVLVSVHPLLNLPTLRAYGRHRPPFITVVTDLVSTHAWWYYPDVDLCCVPTEPARRRALRCGLPPEKVRLTGLPVAMKFARPLASKADLRQRLGWSMEAPVVLLIGGGEGMGPVYEIARQVAAAGLNCQLAVVAGRNEALRQRLTSTPWPIPVFAYGFVTDMPELMGAADILVTKAGPSTISEAFTAGLPIILSGAIPGQEEGNVEYVVSEGAGVWAPGPELVRRAVERWLGGPDGAQALAAAAANSRRLARADASRAVAEEIGRWLRP